VDITTRKSEDYGSVKVRIVSPFSSMIVELLSEKNELLVQYPVRVPGEAYFLFLSPKTYKLRAVADPNRNGAWDTGKYLNRLQPEKVFLYKEEIKIKANWEMELDWVITPDQGR
jgi:hypothetical protein